MKAVTVPVLTGTTLSTFYTYDTLGNTITESEPIANISPATIDDPANDPLAFRYSYDLTNSNPAFRNRILSSSDVRNPEISSPPATAIQSTAIGTLLTTVTDPAAAVTTTRHFADGKFKEVIDANQTGKPIPLKTSYTYRSDGLPASITGPDDISTWFTAYDANGNDTEIKDATGTLRETITLTYDARNRVKTSTVSASGQPDLVTSYDYDANDNRTSTVDPELKATSYVYTYNGKIKQITDANNKLTKLDYGSGGCTSCGGGGGDS